MRFKPYPKYKPSGVEWLGDVPEGWKIISIKWLSPVSRGASPRPIDDPKYFDDAGEYAWVRIADVSASTGELIETTQRLSTLGSDLSVKIKPGELFISIAGTVGKPCISAIKACIHDGFVYFPKLPINPYFVYRIFEAGTCYGGLGKWGTQLNLNTDTIGSIKIALPSDAEIENITTFLDRETAKIDTLISKQEKLIELLREKRQAVILNAVTKGLNPNVPMKDSGVEWLGDVPEHWKVSAVGYRYEIALGKMLDQKKITGNHLAPYLRNTDVQWGCINTSALPEMDFNEADKLRYLLIPGDLLVCEGGEVGRCAIWNKAGEFYYQKALHRMRPYDRKRDVTKFMSFLLENAARQGRFTAGEARATIAHLPAEALRAYRFGFPSEEEQTEIVGHIEASNLRINTLIAKAEQAIALQKEHRTALISAAVTGKIDVPSSDKKKDAA